MSRPLGGRDAPPGNRPLGGRDAPWVTSHPLDGGMPPQPRQGAFRE
jgi:hypothetical protein